ncbi:hypothetical protein C2W62_29615 [Candidatus Entotheonella serta]|nr:hypothetical protein C2W62_29615 [Candidatus Entotheonella serta]
MRVKSDAVDRERRDGDGGQSFVRRAYHQITDKADRTPLKTPAIGDEGKHTLAYAGDPQRPIAVAQLLIRYLFWRSQYGHVIVLHADVSSISMIM